MTKCITVVILHLSLGTGIWNVLLYLSLIFNSTYSLSENVYRVAVILQKPDEDSMCGQSNWRAAGNTIKKKRNLVETGLEISGCRHALAQHSINMMYGEVYGYAHYLQVNYYITKKVQFFWYDVVCKYWPWLKKNDPGTAQKMKPALSVMHAKAHAWSCQVCVLLIISRNNQFSPFF